MSNVAKRELTIGKLRGLQNISTERGLFTMVALDHQESFRKGINSTAPDGVPYQKVVDLKLDIIAALSPHSSALLTDLRYGAAQAVAAGVLLGRTGLLVTLEQSPGYGPGETIARRTVLVRGWSVAKIRRMGASAVKLLVYYHPQSETAGFQENLVSQVAADCREHDIPLVLEVLTHPIEPGQAKESAAFAATRPAVVIESARRLCPFGADLYKAEFPADMKYESDEAKILGWCKDLTEAAGIPWVVLSAAVNHDVFCRQVEIACQGGASGFLAGRSIWKEALGLGDSERKEFLAGEATRRLKELNALADRYARPWTTWYQTAVGEGWYERY
jgi:tagatose 1,6-diphosphate aldolase